MKEKTNFSLVMPLYNSKSTLGKAIKSIFSQSYKNYELILVDDCSTDGSYEIVKKFATENKKITSYWVEKKSALYCMNFGIKRAKYEWIRIADSDAIETKNWLKIINSNIDKNTGVIGGKCVHAYPKNAGYFNKVFYYVESSQFPNTHQIDGVPTYQ